MRLKMMIIINIVTIRISHFNNMHPVVTLENITIESVMIQFFTGRYIYCLTCWPSAQIW